MSGRVTHLLPVPAGCPFFFKRQTVATELYFSTVFLRFFFSLALAMMVGCVLSPFIFMFSHQVCCLQRYIIKPVDLDFKSDCCIHRWDL